MRLSDAYVVHRGRVGEQQPLPLDAVAVHRREAAAEVHRHALAELGVRADGRQVVQRLLHRHRGPQLARVVLAPAEQRADLAGQHTAAGVVLQGELPLVDAERVGGRLVEDLLDLLQLDEVVAGTDGSEAQPGELERQTRQFAGQPAAAAVAVKVDAAELLDAAQLVAVHAEPAGREQRPVDGRPAYLGRGQLAHGARRVRVPLADVPVELLDAGPAGLVAVQRDQRHAAVHRRGRERRPDRVDRRDRHRGRQFHVPLVVEVRQDDRGRRQVGVAHLGVQLGEHPRVGGQRRPVEHPGLTRNDGYLH